MPAQPLIISGSVTAKAPMSRIDRYILSQFLTLFGFFALVLVSVYWINRAVSLFEQLISDGQTALVVLEFTALTLPLVISVVLPIAAFAASASRAAPPRSVSIPAAASLSTTHCGTRKRT